MLFRSVSQSRYVVLNLKALGSEVLLCSVVGQDVHGIKLIELLQEAGINCSAIIHDSSRKTTVKTRVLSGSQHLLRIDQDGFILDHGFQVINPKYPEVARSNILNDLDFKYISGSIRLAELNKKIGYNIGSLSPKIGGITEKLNFLAFILNPNIKNSYNFRHYAIRFPKLYATALKPFLTGVFLTDPENIAADVAQDIVRSFVKSLPGVPAEGVSKFSNKLAEPIENIKYFTKVEKISGNKVFTSQGNFTGQYIVVATDPVSASNLIDNLKLPKMLTSISMYFSTSNELPDAKNLVISQQSKLVNSIVMNKVSEKYAPAGLNLISATSLQALSENDFRDQLS